MKKYLSTIIFASLILLVVGFVIFALTRPETTEQATEKNRKNRSVVEADVSKLSQGHSKGPENAKVVLTEFGDFQCPACKKYESILKDEILVKYSQNLRLVFLHYPLPNHPNAEAAAQAAEAAALQNKFWEMHDLLYEKQDEWAKEKNAKSKFESYARHLGLDIDKFKADYESQIVIDLVQQNAALGDAFKITGTPTFFVNGKEVDLSKGSANLGQVIEQALNQS